MTLAALAWLDLLPYAEAEDVASWLDERGAFECHARGGGDLGDSTTWPIVAAVLAGVLGDPWDVIEGKA